MHFYRGSFRAVAGCSSKLLNDEEVSAAMRVLDPQDVIACEHVRMLMEVTAHGPCFLRDTLVVEGTWLRKAFEALSRDLQCFECD